MKRTDAKLISIVRITFERSMIMKKETLPYPRMLSLR